MSLSSRFAIITQSDIAQHPAVKRVCTRMGLDIKDVRDLENAFAYRDDQNIDYWSMFHLLSEDVFSPSNVIVLSRINLRQRILLSRMKFIVIVMGDVSISSRLYDISTDAEGLTDVLHNITRELPLKHLRSHFKSAEAAITDFVGYEHRAYGKMVRGVLMDYAKRRNIYYVGLGDEYESVIQANEMRMRSAHVRYPDGWHDGPGRTYEYMGPRDMIMRRGISKYRADANRILADAIDNPSRYRSMMLCGLFSLSNTFNPKPVSYLGVMQQLARKGVRVAINFPRKLWALRQYRDHLYDVKTGVLKTRINDENQFTDWVLDESLVGRYSLLHMYDSDEVECMGIFHNYDFRSVSKFGYCPTTRQVDEWILVTNFALYTEEIQTCMTSPTFFDRAFSLSLRWVAQLNEDYLYRFRYECIRSYLPDITLVEDTYDKFLFNGTIYTVSGHFINLLLLSELMSTNFVSYLRCAYNNMYLHYMGDQKDIEDYYGKLNSVFHDGVTVERDAPDTYELWHTCEEYVFSLVVVLNLAKIFKLKLSLNNLVHGARFAFRSANEFGGSGVFDSLFPGVMSGGIGIGNQKPAVVSEDSVQV